MSELKRISYPSRPSLALGSLRVSALQALACIVLVDASQRGEDGAGASAAWRRWLAGNLTLIEYQRKAWKTQTLAGWWRRTIRELRGLGLVNMFNLDPTDNGRAVAAGLRLLFNDPMPVGQLVGLNRQIYAQKTGRFE